LSTNASKKAEEAVKTGRLVVSGQLLQMLTTNQRPRSTVSSSAVDKTRKGPLSWKLRDISLKNFTASVVNEPKKLQTATAAATVPKLQIEADGVYAMDNEKLECADEGETVGRATADTLTSVFCPRITSVVSLENKG